MIPFPKRAALVAALASIAALAVPAAASATVAPPNVNGNTLTVTSDGAGDTITLAAAGGVITVNGAATTLTADNNAAIVVNAGGGNDTVDASALGPTNYGSLMMSGGEGDDILTGGAKADRFTGDGGNDRLVGFKGSDSVFGGDGNDVLVWNNGDGTDRNDGDAGTDEVEVNGSPTAGDAFIFGPDTAEPGRVDLVRTNLVPFAINLNAERLTVNGLGGDDSASPDPDAPTGLAGLTALTLNGGTGADHLAGGDGADLIQGGDDADTLSGNGGDDRLIGDRGTDTVGGDAGDDVLVWNNGDGSDTNAGGTGFDRVEVNGSATAGDEFTLAPDGTDARFERTNLVPFTITLTSAPGAADRNGGVEAVAVNGGGGDDRFTVSPGLPDLLVRADGDAGADVLTGSEEEDSFFGGSGSDALIPGAGSDLVDGEEGDDAKLLTRDGTGDLVRGGAGTDQAQTDAVTVDAISGVETLDATPPADDKVALLPKLGRIAVTRSHGKLVAHAPVTCPAAEAGGCRMTLTLETAKRVRMGKARAVLGSKAASLRPGQRSTLSIRLADATAGLARHGKLAVRARIASHDAAGNFASGSKAVVLRIPGR